MDRHYTPLQPRRETATESRQSTKRRQIRNFNSHKIKKHVCEIPMYDIFIMIVFSFLHAVVNTVCFAKKKSPSDLNL